MNVSLYGDNTTIFRENFPLTTKEFLHFSFFRSAFTSRSSTLHETLISRCSSLFSFALIKMLYFLLLQENPCKEQKKQAQKSKLNFFICIVAHDFISKSRETLFSDSIHSAIHAIFIVFPFLGCIFNSIPAIFSLL